MAPATSVMTRFNAPIFRLFLQHAQSAQERHPHVNQRRQLAGEHREDGRFDSRRRTSGSGIWTFWGRPAPSWPAPGWRCLRDIGRKQTHFLDPLQCLALIGDIQRALAPQSAGIHSLITIAGHDNLVSGARLVWQSLLLIWTMPGCLRHAEMEFNTIRLQLRQRRTGSKTVTLGKTTEISPLARSNSPLQTRNTSLIPFGLTHFG